MNKLIKIFVLLVLTFAYSLTVSSTKLYCGKISIKVGETRYVEAVPKNGGYTASGYWTTSGNGFTKTAEGDYGCKITGWSVGSGTLSYWGVVSIKNTWTTETWDFYWDVEVQPLDTKVSSITITPSPVLMSIGDQVQLTSTISPSNATNKTVTWSSSPEDVVKVDKNSGKLTAQAKGTATITCSATDGSGVTATCEVTVADKVPVTVITLNISSLNLGIDNSRYIRATVEPANTTCTDFTWTSTNPDVATVSGNSKKEDDGTYRAYIRAKALGSTTITCTANDGSGVQASCNVNVYKHGDNSSFTAKTIEGVEFYFKVEDAASGKCEISTPVDRSVSGTITIPGEVDGFQVTSIGNYAFDGLGITNIIIPSSVESIGNGAFYNCKSLSSIALNNVKYLGNGVFIGCSSLTKITNITNLEYIGSNAFHSSSNGDGAIPWYSKLPDGILYLGKVLYKYKGDMPANTEVSVKEGIVSISPWAFSNNGDNLVSINLPKSLSNINYESFMNCSGLKKITVAAGNSTFDSRDNCNAILETSSNTLVVGCKETTIPETTKAIGYWAFYARSPLVVTIPNSVDSIADLAFSNCSSLSSVTIGSGLRTLGTRVFGSCSNLESIIVSENNPYFDSRNDCNAIIETQTNKLVVGTHTSTIPYTVKTIGSYAFYSNSKLERLRIHDGIETIEDYAFAYQSSLTSLTIGKGIKEIGKYAFAYCNKLKGVHSLSDTPIDLDETTFRSSWNSEKQQYDFSKATLFVPRGSMINYMTTEGWSNFEKIVEVDDDAIIDGERFTDETIEGIELTYMVTDAAAKTCELVESPTTIEGKVTIPDQPKGYTVTSLGRNVFSGSNTERKITEVVIPEHVTAIGYDAFYYVKTLKSISIPQSVKTIEGWAFSSCGLTSVDIPNSVDSIGNFAFSSNSLESITIGKGLRKLGENPFRYNSELKSITVDTGNPYLDSRDNCNAIIEKSTNKLVVSCPATVIPSTVKALGDYSFYSYSNYTMTLPDNVEEIGKYAFGYSSLRSVTIGKNVRKINSNAFLGCYNLLGIHVLHSTPLEIEESVFSYYSDRKDTIYNNATLFVPIGSKAKYMASAGWSKFKKIEEIEDDAIINGERFTDETVEGIELTYMVTDVVAKTCELVESPTTIEGKVTIPDQPKGYTVTSLGRNVFSGSNTERKITEVVIPEHVTAIGYDAFYYVKTLKSISIPQSVKTIEGYAFSSCGLTSVDIPNSVDSIGYYAFSSNSLESITIGKGLRKLGGNAFSSNSKLKSITVDTGNPYLDSRDNCNAIIEKKTNTLIVGCPTTVIPSTVKAIGDYSFYRYSNYTMTLPDNVEAIGEYAFGYSSLRSMTIGKNVRKINSNAFYGCYNLLGIHVLHSTPLEIEESVFSCYDPKDSIYNNAILYVPIGAKAKYMATAVWSKFKRIEEIEDDAIHAGMVFESDTPEGITLTYVITDALAKTCQLLASPSEISGELTIPPTPEGYTLTEIGRSTFSGRGITAVMIPETVQSIQPYAFASCRELKSVYSQIQEPFDVDSLAFSVYNNEDKKYYFTDATLYVPIGTKAKYEVAEGWKYFKDIIEFDPKEGNPIEVNIQNLTSDIEKENSIYNLSGQRLEKPRKGVNIIGGKKVLVK